MKLLSKPEMIFCLKGLQIISKLDILQDPIQRENPQVEFMVLTLKKIYSDLEKINMAIRAEFLNVKTILAILENEALAPPIIKEITESTSIDVIIAFFEVQNEVYEVFEKENNPSRFAKVSTNTKFYNVLSAILLRRLNPEVVRFPSLLEALRVYTKTISWFFFLKTPDSVIDFNVLESVVNSIHLYEEFSFLYFLSILAWQNFWWSFQRRIMLKVCL